MILNDNANDNVSDLSVSNSALGEIAVLLVNLGTPDEPTPQAVRRYLKQFLSDPRVIEIPAVVWSVILHLFVLPFRSKRVAHAYASIWQADSPMRQILRDQCQAVQAKLQSEFLLQNVSVYPAMTYGNPNVKAVLGRLADAGVEHILIFPLFPQYSATSTGAVYDAVSDWLKSRRNLPNISFVKDYHDDFLYIKALAHSVRSFQNQHGKPDKLLFSFHGIPKPYADKGDPYPQQCHKTASLVARELGLGDDDWLVSFQSRFGKQEWVKPYTDAVLQEWGRVGKSVQVISPAFSADCLETLEELAVENRDLFLQAGGKSYAYIPALNTDDLHLQMMAERIATLVGAWANPQGRSLVDRMGDHK